MNRATFLILIFAMTGNLSAADYSEVIFGDFSDDQFAPTILSVDVGDNPISATSGSGDIEYFQIRIPENHELSAIVLNEYGNEFGVSFLGVQSGLVFTEPANGTDTANLLGYHLFGAADLGNDVLAAIGTGAGSQGFTPPLPAGDYTFWSQETGAAVDYAYTLQVAQVPEPSAASGFVLATLLAGFCCRKR